MYQEPTYPTVRFILRHDRVVVGAAFLLLPVAAVLFMLPDFHWRVFVGALVAGAVSGFLMRSYVEIIRIIADTLLPR